MLAMIRTAFRPVQDAGYGDTVSRYGIAVQVVNTKDFRPNELR
jgi:hypothetical protein